MVPDHCLPFSLLTAFVIVISQGLLEGTVKGKRRKGRLIPKWEDNIKEWTGMAFASSVRAGEDRTRWKGSIVVICGAPTTSRG